MNPWRDYFEHLAEEWDAMQRGDRQAAIDHLLGVIDEQITQGGNVLDVGTGTGAIIPLLKDRYPTSKLASIDLATEMLMRAQCRVPDSFLIQTDVHMLPFADGTFTSVICHNSFPHFWEKELALIEMRRVLVPEGKLFVIHDISRHRVNEIHTNSKSKYIRQDILPTGEALGQMMQRNGYIPLTIEDTNTHYIVSGRVEPSFA